MVLTFPQIGLRHSRVQTENITISPFTSQVLLLIRYTRFHFQYCYYCVAASFNTRKVSSRRGKVAHRQKLSDVYRVRNLL